MARRPSALPTLLALLALVGPAAGAGADELSDGFRRPPDTAKPWAYMMVMDGHLGREGMTADLESLKAAGLGGLTLMEVDVGIPKGPVEFMSPEWRARFVQAVREAERLGLQIALNAGPGWTGSGGPWVAPDQSMQHIVAAEAEAVGPTRFDAVLPKPEPRPPYFGSKLPAELEAARRAFYRDVAVLAFPTPAGAARIEDIDEKAFYKRDPYSSLPGVKPFLPAPAYFPAAPAGSAVAAERIVDLTSRLGPDGRLVWDVPPGRWTILRFGRTTTGANTRPAPRPGLGLECDKFDPAALDAHFEAFVGSLLKELGPRRPGGRAGWTMLHLDSWEMSAQNWSAAFRTEFRRRRGYDPLRYLPAVTGRVVESIEITERFLWDLRQTAQELVVENYAGRLKELGRRRGFGLSIEPYDMNPCADLELGSVADVPMGEFWANGLGFDTAYSCIEAASIAHTRGRPVVAAEAFTSDDRERWRLYPGAMKPQADWALCQGINRIVFHRWAHQPRLDRFPGMTMGPYGVHWERTQTWWDMAAAFHEYLARCQYLLQKGRTVADICYLTPEGAPQVFRPPLTALEGEAALPDRRGYNFDGCAPGTLLERMSVRDGRVVTPDGASYRLLVLPAFETMTPALLRRLKELVERGAVVVGAPVRKSPGLSGYPDCDAEVRSLALEIWGRLDAPAAVVRRAVGRGLILWGGDLRPAAPDLYPSYEPVARLLADLGLPPDFEAEGGGLRYTHRTDGEAEIYFVANKTAAPRTTAGAFRVAGKTPELWDPLSGEIRPASGWRAEKSRTFVPLDLSEFGSVFVVFRAGRPAAGDRIPAPPAERPLETVLELTGPWEVRFDPARGGPADPVSFPTLADWSTRADDRIRYYSGRAVYRTSFDLPGSALSGRCFLRLGVVQVMARVKLNGRDLGVVWCAPWRVEAPPGSLMASGNELEIEVANLWCNRLIGDAGLPPERRVAWTTWNPFKPEDPLLPSGLLGPVSISF
jgi:hypothetical protein